MIYEKRKGGIKIMEEHEKEIMRTKGFGWRVSLSIVASVGWLVFLILWLFFYAGNYVWEQNIAIILMSILVMIVILGFPWMIWGMRHRKKIDLEMWETKGFKWRVWISGILAFALMIFLIYWFWYLAEPYSVYQNIAVLIVSFLIIGGALGASWAPWGIKHGHKFEQKKPTSYYHKEKSEETEDEEEKKEDKE